MRLCARLHTYIVPMCMVWRRTDVALSYHCLNAACPTANLPQYALLSLLINRLRS
jgi:hypothetical protein